MERLKFFAVGGSVFNSDYLREMRPVVKPEDGKYVPCVVVHLEGDAPGLNRRLAIDEPQATLLEAMALAALFVRTGGSLLNGRNKAPAPPEGTPTDG